jgi:acyl-coenzyme A thioesterase PaaI-like protein
MRGSASNRLPEHGQTLMSKPAVADHPDTAAIRAQLLRGIAGNRTPGLHFAGYFLDLALPRFDGDRVELDLPHAPHTTGADGQFDLTALCMLADTALATATRSQVANGARLATLHLQMQFTGLPATSAVRAIAQPLGACSDTAVPQLLATATIATATGTLCHTTAEFAALAPPPGVALAPLPWQLATPPAIAALTAKDLAADERPIYKAGQAALKKASAQPAFIQHFWGGLPLRTQDGARTRFAVGAHLGNRVGHVQGGISVGIAARTACVAAPAHMLLSNIAAWYISPGRGKALTVRSRVVHAGKTIAVVRTEVKTDTGARVLEVVTHHVARKRD